MLSLPSLASLGASTPSSPRSNGSDDLRGPKRVVARPCGSSPLRAPLLGVTAILGVARRRGGRRSGALPLPTLHLIKDTWYHKVGCPEGPPAAAHDEMARNHQQLHLLQGHRDSFKHFLTHLFPKQLELVKDQVRLSDNSYVLISEEEALQRGVESLKVAEGLCTVRLKDLHLPLSQGRRFSVQLLADRLYYVESEDSPAVVQLHDQSYTCTAVVPMKVSDAATGLDIEVHVELGKIPMLTEYGTFIVRGNPYIIAHRLERMAGCYFTLETSASVMGYIHQMELVTEQYSRTRIVCQVNKDGEEEIFFILPRGKSPMPAGLVLFAVGLSEEEIRRARNGSWILSCMRLESDIEGDPTEFACRQLCELIGARFTVETFQDDPVAAFSFKTSWSLFSRVGPLGRRRLNERLGLNLTEETVTPKDLLAAADLLADSFRGNTLLQEDDKDSLENKRLRVTGHKMENMIRDWLDLVSKEGLQITVDRVDLDLRGQIEGLSTRETLEKFCFTQLFKENNRQAHDCLNPLSEIMQARRITQVSELGLDKIKRIQEIRLIHPSQYGRVCPIETGEGMSAGIVQAMAQNTRVSEDGELQAPHQRVAKGVRLLDQPWEYLLARDQLSCRVAQFDQAHSPDGSLCAPARPERGSSSEKAPIWQPPSSVPVTHLGLFGSCAPEQVEYIACGPPVSVGVGSIPFLEHDDANRALMGGKHQQQALPTLWPERPVVGSGMEAHVAASSGRSQHAGLDGQILYSDAQTVTCVSSEVTQADPEVQKLRKDLREFYLQDYYELRLGDHRLNESTAEKYRLSTYSYADLNELCVRLPRDELERVATALSGRDDAVKRACLSESFARVGILPRKCFPETVELLAEELERLVAARAEGDEAAERACLSQSFAREGSFTRDGITGEDEQDLPDGWVETEYCIRVDMAHRKLVDITQSKKHHMMHDTNTVTVGDVVCAGDVVAEGQGISGGESAIGKNLVVAYMPFQGYNYEDAIAVSARLVREDLLTTIHIDEIVMQLDPDEYLCTPEEIDALGYMSEGLVCDGVWLEAGDVAICARRRATALDATSDDEQPRVRRVPEGVRGRVIGSSIKQIEEYDGKAFVLRESAVVLLAYRCRIGVGDKLSGRHGNKGIVSIVVDDRDMPYLPDGTPIDVCLNPLGVPSRMNVGQIFENLLGSAGRWNGEEYRVGTFDEMFAEEASRGLVFDALRRAQESTGYKWLLDGETPGKTRVYDGRTGMPLDQPVTVGVSYIIKLCHMVKDKIHSRGFRLEKGYNMLTMQPIKGRKHGGGLRLGEMEVSGIIGHGASQLLQELLTLKSDDVFGRNETYEKLKQGEEVVLPKGATSEGYRTFRRELAASGLAIIEGSWDD
ncbi:DNA-directed RNA polymerase subunit beta (RNAP subunit beta) (RNA polymerase subunit beta) (Transcriptase subunit beta) [Durusdinium trenchii]|uniref:DNA-directed RNA polymerase subunit beta n=1 Tax=Durusdinium trenchii TaxID=1381693 RepID=A0ABP0NXI4_9DINO